MSPCAITVEPAGKRRRGSSLRASSICPAARRRTPSGQPVDGVPLPDALRPVPDCDRTFAAQIGVHDRTPLCLSRGHGGRVEQGARAGRHARALPARRGARRGRDGPRLQGAPRRRRPPGRAEGAQAPAQRRPHLPAAIRARGAGGRGGARPPPRGDSRVGRVGRQALPRLGLRRRRLAHRAHRLRRAAAARGRGPRHHRDRGGARCAARGGRMHRDIKPSNVLFDSAGTHCSPTSASRKGGPTPSSPGRDR